MSDNGHLVLGDFGIAIEIDDKSGRLTDTLENVGSRDFMPGWAYGMRLEDVTPKFDAFSLGKILWSMISGKQKFQLWYHNKPQNDLEKLFPDSPHMKFAGKILEKCVVESEEDCCTTSDLVTWINQYITVIENGGQPLSKTEMRCPFCGLGHYQLQTGSSDTDFKMKCDYCGNWQNFDAKQRGWNTG